jgi:serine/threonine protein kinase
LSDIELDRLPELVGVASRLEAATHASFLLAAEPLRADLREEALSLLAHDSGRGELVAPSVGESSRIGPYSLLECLCETPPARMFRAHEADDSGRHALLLVAEPGSAASRIAEDLSLQVTKQEALCLPGLVHLTAAGQAEDGRVFAAFGPFEGAPLAQFADALRLSLTGRIALVEALALSVERAHAAGLVPLSILPWSVLGSWSDQGPTVHLMALDWWPLLASLDPECRPGATLLSCLETCAPEVLRGAQRSIGTDVYSLGALLYEMVTGTPAHGSRQNGGQRSLREELRLAADITIPLASERIARQGASADACALLRSTTRRALLRDLHAGLDSIVDGALSSDPSLRPRSAGALAQQLAVRRPKAGGGLGAFARHLYRNLGNGEEAIDEPEKES